MRGWAKGRVLDGGVKVPPPDLSPAESYGPFHYRHPVTGKWPCRKPVVLPGELRRKPARAKLWSTRPVQSLPVQIVGYPELVKDSSTVYKYTPFGWANCETSG